MLTFEASNFNSNPELIEQLVGQANATGLPGSMRYMLRDKPDLIFGHILRSTPMGLFMVEYHGIWDSDLEEPNFPLDHVSMSLGNDQYWRFQGRGFGMMHFEMGVELGRKNLHRLIKNPSSISLSNLNGFGIIIDRPARAA